MGSVVTFKGMFAVRADPTWCCQGWNPWSSWGKAEPPRPCWALPLWGICTGSRDVSSGISSHGSSFVSPHR